MKTVLLFIIVILFFTVLVDSCSSAEITDQFLYGLAWVESSNNHNVKPGDGGRSHGLLQEQNIYRREANRIKGYYLFSFEDIKRSPEAQKECARIVLEFWSKYHRVIDLPEIVSLHRCPNTKWNRRRMHTAHEQRRTKTFWQHYSSKH